MSSTNLNDLSHKNPINLQDQKNLLKQNIKTVQVKLDLSIPAFLPQSNTRKFIEPTSGEIIYIRDNGEAYFQRS